MNIEYAKTLPLPEILSKMGLEPVQQDGHLLIYFSPFSNRPEPTLQVDTVVNTWRDTVKGTGGNTLDFIKAYLEHHHLHCSEPDALKWLKFNISYPSLLSFVELPDDTTLNRKLVFKYQTMLLERNLILYVESLGIPAAIARKFLKQVYVLNNTTGKEFLAIGHKNEEGGYAIYSSYIKASIAPAAITFIRGRIAKPDGVHVFKNIFDYLIAFIARGNKPFDKDSIILNGYGCMDNATAYIRGYGYRTLYTWFDDSETGKAVTKAFAWLCSTEERLEHRQMGMR